MCADTLSTEKDLNKNLLARDACRNIRDDVMHTTAVNKISKRKGPRFRVLWSFFFSKNNHFKGSTAQVDSEALIIIRLETKARTLKQHSNMAYVGQGGRVPHIQAIKFMRETIFSQRWRTTASFRDIHNTTQTGIRFPRFEETYRLHFQGSVSHRSWVPPRGFTILSLSAPGTYMTRRLNAPRTDLHVKTTVFRYVTPCSLPPPSKHQAPLIWRHLSTRL